MNHFCLVAAGVLAAGRLHGSELTDSNYTSTYSASTSFTAEGEITRHGSDYGNLSSTLTRASYVASRAINEQWRWSVGPLIEYSRFEATKRALIPEEGFVTALHLGAVWQINEPWSARFDIRPGLYTDYKDVSGSDFNAPFVAAVTYACSSNLMWVLGIGVNLRSDLGTIGGPGVRWRFADDWTLNLILPKPTIDYTLMRGLDLYAGGEWRSTYFRVGENFGSARGKPVLNNDDFTYRELRGVAGLRWTIARELRIDLEGGYAFNRRAEFRAADVTIKADGAPFVQLAVGGSF